MLRSIQGLIRIRVTSGGAAARLKRRIGRARFPSIGGVGQYWGSRSTLRCFQPMYLRPPSLFAEVVFLAVLGAILGTILALIFRVVAGTRAPL